jgi:hypothetical protein
MSAVAAGSEDGRGLDFGLVQGWLQALPSPRRTIAASARRGSLVIDLTDSARPSEL